MGKKENAFFIIFFRWLLFGFIFALCSFCFFTEEIKVKAANHAVISNGNIVFETIDTKAVSNIRWMSVGFTIRKDSSHGNPLKNETYAEIRLQPNYQEIEDQGNGTYHITYTIPKAKVDRILIRAGMDGIKDGDSLYFNTIFKLKVYNVIQNKQYYQLNDIRNAAHWRNPNDFKEHFDIKVTFHSAKYPVAIEYRTMSNQLIKRKEIGNFKAGEEVSTEIDGKKNFHGTEYILCKSYYMDLSKPEKKRNVKIVPESNYGQGHGQSGTLKIGGMKIIARMKKKPDPPEEPPPVPDFPYTGKPPRPIENIEKKIFLEKINAESAIKAEKKGNENYDAEIAIPSGEKLYVEGNADEALLEYKFIKYQGSVVYHINVKADYILRWQTKVDDEWVWNSRTVNGDRMVYIEKEYSYWTVDYFHYDTVDKMIIENETFPAGKVEMSAKEKEVTFDYRATKHKEPLIKEIEISMGSYVQTVSSASSSPSWIDYDKIAKKEAKEIKTANDFLEFQEIIIMEDKECIKNTDRPKEPELSDSIVEFYKDGLTIPEEKKNQEYLSEGTLYYKRRVSLEDVDHASENIVYAIDGINSVTVFTPIACQGEVSDQAYLCQSVTANPARCQLVLDTDFSIAASCYGTHLSYKGYGTQDYQRFCKDLEVCIPFDVYKGEVFYPAGTWNRFSGEQQYYLPIWVKEGEYTISFRATAKNGTIGQLGMEAANLDPDYYAATASVPVEISGRLYGLKLYDITDYPLWRDVFRKKDSNELSGLSYYIGTRNQNGIETGLKSLYTLPILADSHPYYQNIGYLKTGYIIRCSLKTIGSFYHKEDVIEIEPEFYFVNKDGNREKVALYYNESFLGKYQNLIRVGSERDKQNIRSLHLGKEGLSVNLQEIEDTAFLKKCDIDTMKNKEVIWHGYKDLLLPSTLQTFSGIYHMKGKKKALPINSSTCNILQAKQTWYFEYYLPASYYIAPYEFDLETYAKQVSIDFKESFWKKEGFLIVQFHIYANKNGKRELCYINKDKKYCNMWKMEGYQYHRMDENGNNFYLKDGDFLVFSYGNKQSSSVGEDYASFGTH